MAYKGEVPISPYTIPNAPNDKSKFLFKSGFFYYSLWTLGFQKNNSQIKTSYYKQQQNDFNEVCCFL